MTSSVISNEKIDKRAAPEAQIESWSPPGRRELLLAACVCALLVVCFLGPAIFRGRIISPADMLFNYYPWQAEQPPGWTGPSNDLLLDSVAYFEPWGLYTGQRLGEGELPLWNPHDMLGAPFIANMQSAVFYPLNWPVFAQPAGFALDLRAALKLFVALFGMYLLARRVARVGPLGASVAALTFGFGAFVVVWLLHPLTAVVIWLPWLWLATALVVDRPVPRNAALLALVVALSLLGGHVETAYHVAWATGLFALFHAWQTWGFSRGGIARAMAVWVASYVLGALVASVQIVPFLEYSSISAASAIRLSSSGPAFSLPPAYAWTSVTPDIFGNPSQHTWWGMAINYNESNNYAGVLPILLAPFSLLARNASHRRFALFLLLVIVLAASLVYGFPVLSQLMLLLPGMHLLFNTRMTLVLQFGLGLLAAIGVEGIRERLNEKRPTLAIAALISVVVLLCLGVLLPWLLAGDYIAVAFNAALARTVWRDALVRATVLILLGGAAIGLPLLLGRLRAGQAALGMWLLPVLLAIDLFSAHMSYIPSVDPPDYFPQTGSIRFLQSQPGLFRAMGPSQVFVPSANLMYGLDDLRGTDIIEPLSYRELAVRQALKLSTPAKFTPAPLLNLLNVRYILTAPGDNPSVISDTVGGVSPWFVKVFDGGSRDMSVFENRRVLPRAWLVHHVEVEADSAARLRRLSDPAFPAADTAVLSAPLGPSEPLPVSPAQGSADRVTITVYKPEAVEIEAESAQPGLLILSDQAFPGWSVRVDGQPGTWVTADHSLRGVYLGAGSHKVQFEYEPGSFALGAWLSAFSMLVLVGLVSWPWVLARRRTDPGSKQAGGE